MSTQTPTITAQKGRRPAAPATAAVATSIALGATLGVLGKILADHGPTGSAAVLGLPSVWVVLCWWCGARTERRDIAIASACGLLLASVISYYVYDGIRLNATWQTEIGLARPWLILALPSALLLGAAGIAAQRATRAGAVCRALPPAMAAIPISFMLIKGVDASELWSAVTLILLAFAVLRGTPWRQHARLLAVSTVVAAAGSALAFALIFSWASSAIGP